MARLVEIDWPEYGPEPERPIFSVEELQARMAALRSQMDARGWTHVVVYGDREHFANLA